MDTLYDDFRATFHSIWHRRWLALGIAWSICIIGWLVVAMIPSSYESHARIYVQLNDALATQFGIGDNERQHDIDRVRNTLTSTKHLEQVIRATALGDNISSRKDMDSAVATLGKNIKVTSDQDNLFAISATSGSLGLRDADNSKLAKQIVQKMIDIFHDENLANNAGEMKDSMSFLDTQLASRQKELEAAEQRRLAFESLHPELAQGGVSMIQRLESDRSETRNIDGDLAAAQSGLAAVSGQMAGTPQSVAGVGVTGGARGALAQAQSDLAMMRARGLTENHPDVIAMRNQIVALRSQASAEGAGTFVGGVPNPAYLALQSQRADRQASIQALMARKASVESDIATATAQQTTNPDLVAQAQNISRDYDVLKQNYDKLLQGREELRLKGAVENTHNSIKFQVIDPPTTPRTPIAPNRPMLLFMVLVIGIGAGAGVAFAAGELRSTFGTTAKLGRVTGMPVLGAISQSLSAAGQAARTRKTMVFYATAGALGGVFVMLLAMEFVSRSMVA